MATFKMIENARLNTTKGVFKLPYCYYDRTEINTYEAVQYSGEGYALYGDNYGMAGENKYHLDDSYSASNPFWLRYDGDTTPSYANLGGEFAAVFGFTIAQQPYVFMAKRDGTDLYWKLVDSQSNIVGNGYLPQVYQSNGGYYKYIFLSMFSLNEVIGVYNFGFTIVPYGAQWSTDRYVTDFGGAGSNLFSHIKFVTDDPYSTLTDDNPEGGYGNFDYSSDDIDYPTLPSISASSCGFVRLYNPTISEVQDLADYLWSGAFDIATFRKIFGDPMDCILSLGIVPVTPPRSINKEEMSFAGIPDPGVTAYRVTDQFTSIDCGSVTLSGRSASAMDYSPYTKLTIFLPYCGTHDLSVDDCMDATIGVKYLIDLYTGVCVAHVKVTKTNSDGSEVDSVLYQFTGNVLCTIPLTSADHSQFIQSALFAAAATAATIASSGGAAAAGAGEIGGAAASGDVAAGLSAGQAARMSAAAINSVMSLKPDITRSGNLSANAGFLGEQKPILIATWPNLCRPEDEYKLSGMPLQKSGTLGDFTGFTIVSSCHLDNLLCTQEELRLIEQALYTGVIV